MAATKGGTANPGCALFNAARTGNASLERDGWSVRTAEGSLSAHYEHTVVIARGQPILSV